MKPIDFEKIVGEESWGKHWKNHEQMLFLMAELQKHSDKIKEIIISHFKK